MALGLIRDPEHDLIGLTMKMETGDMDTRQPETVLMLFGGAGWCNSCYTNDSTRPRRFERH